MSGNEYADAMYQFIHLDTVDHPVMSGNEYTDAMYLLRGSGTRELSMHHMDILVSVLSVTLGMEVRMDGSGAIVKEPNGVSYAVNYWDELVGAERGLRDAVMAEGEDLPRLLAVVNQSLQLAAEGKPLANPVRTLGACRMLLTGDADSLEALGRAYQTLHGITELRENHLRDTRRRVWQELEKEFGGSGTGGTE